MQISELNHVAIHVADLARSCDFYERVLRLPSIPRPDFDFPGAWFRLGQTQELHLIGRREEKVSSGSRSNHFALRVGDIAAWERHLVGVGAYRSISWRVPIPRYAPTFPPHEVGGKGATRLGTCVGSRGGPPEENHTGLSTTATSEKAEPPDPWPNPPGDGGPNDRGMTKDG